MSAPALVPNASTLNPQAIVWPNVEPVNPQHPASRMETEEILLSLILWAPVLALLYLVFQRIRAGFSRLSLYSSSLMASNSPSYLSFSIRLLARVTYITTFPLILLCRYFWIITIMVIPTTVIALSVIFSRIMFPKLVIYGSIVLENLVARITLLVLLPIARLLTQVSPLTIQQAFQELSPEYYNYCTRQIHWSSLLSKPVTRSCLLLKEYGLNDFTLISWDASDAAFYAEYVLRSTVTIVSSTTWDLLRDGELTAAFASVWQGSRLQSIASSSLDTVSYYASATSAFALFLYISALISLSALLILTVYLLLSSFLAVYRVISQYVQPVPYFYGKTEDVTKIDQYISALKDALVFTLVAPTNAGHKNLAKFRKSCEATMRGFLLSLGGQITDVGGSLKRHANFGNSVHICIPGESTADRERLDRCHNTTNDIGLHYFRDCTKNANSCMSVYSANHLSVDELAKIGSTKVGLVLEHDPVNRKFDFHLDPADKNSPLIREGELCVNGSDMTMRTTGGTTYEHSYYLWKDQGIIVGDKHACYYKRVASNTAMATSLYILYPLRGAAVGSHEWPELRSSIPTLSSSIKLHSLDEVFEVVPGSEVWQLKSPLITYEVVYLFISACLSKLRLIQRSDSVARDVHIHTIVNAAVSRYSVAVPLDLLIKLVSCLDTLDRDYYSTVDIKTRLLDACKHLPRYLRPIAIWSIYISLPTFIFRYKNRARRDVKVPFAKRPAPSFTAFQPTTSSQITQVDPNLRPFPSSAAQLGGDGPANNDPGILPSKHRGKRPSVARDTRPEPTNPTVDGMAKKINPPLPRPGKNSWRENRRPHHPILPQPPQPAAAGGKGKAWRTQNANQQRHPPQQLLPEVPVPGPSCEISPVHREENTQVPSRETGADGLRGMGAEIPPTPAVGVAQGANTPAQPGEAVQNA